MNTALHGWYAVPLLYQLVLQTGKATITFFLSIIPAILAIVCDLLFIIGMLTSLWQRTILTL